MPPPTPSPVSPRFTTRGACAGTKTTDRTGRKKQRQTRALEPVRRVEASCIVTSEAPNVYWRSKGRITQKAAEAVKGNDVELLE